MMTVPENFICESGEHRDRVCHSLEGLYPYSTHKPDAEEDLGDIRSELNGVPDKGLQAGAE